MKTINLLLPLVDNPREYRVAATLSLINAPENLSIKNLVWILNESRNEIRFSYDEIIWDSDNGDSKK